MKDFQCNWVSKDFVPEFSDSATGEWVMQLHIGGDFVWLTRAEVIELLDAAYETPGHPARNSEAYIPKRYYIAKVMYPGDSSMMTS